MPRWTITLGVCIVASLSCCCLLAIAVTCPALEDIENGLVQLTGRAVGSRATYSCFIGFTLAGNAQRICRNDGTWSGSVPVCRRMWLCTECWHNQSPVCCVCCVFVFAAVDCGELKDPDNGAVDFGTTGFGAIARYRCSTGFVVVGDVSRTCKSDGTWSGSAPTCQREPLLYL